MYSFFYFYDNRREFSRWWNVNHMHNIIISPATTVERDWAASLLASSEPWTTLGVTPEQCRKNCHDPEFEVYIAHVHQEPCGVMILDPRGLAGSPYIKSVAVSKEFRGQKIGERLLEFTEEISRIKARHLFLCVSSFNTGARKFYENHGFTRVGELPGYIIPTASEIIMHKPL